MGNGKLSKFLQMERHSSNPKAPLAKKVVIDFAIELL